MYISKKDREIIRNKYSGKCAYTGTELLPDWQVDHINPVNRLYGTIMWRQNHNIENMVPCQRIINNYKFNMNLKQFRNFMLDFHLRLKRLPKNPKTEKSKKRKENLLEIAKLFGITPDKPFTGKFYFETLNQE